MKKLIKKALRLIMEHTLFYLIPPKSHQAIPCDQAEQILNAHSPDPRTSCLRNNQINQKEYDLSIIIPVYNAEPYLEHCLNSVFQQKTSYRFQVIVINDGSTDGSARILDLFASKKNIMIHHQKNKGHSGARNSGLQLVKGRYIMFLDSDDYLPEDAAEVLLKAAEENQADIVQGGYYHVSESGKTIIATTKYAPNPSVSPNGVIAGMVCGKIYRAELFEQICFPEKYWYEDTIITSILTHLSARISTISNFVYYYRQNPTGITKTSIGKPKSIDTYYVLRCVMEARRSLGMHTDQAFYEHLLRLIVLSYQRTKNEPEPVKRSMFSLFRKMLEDERAGQDFKLHGRQKCLEKMIVAADYRRYCFLCSLP